MTDKVSGKVLITFAKDLLDDVAKLTETTAEDNQASKDEPKCRRVRSTMLGLLR